MSFGGLGLGILMTGVQTASQAAVVNVIDSGRAAVMFSFMRGTGMCVGVALGSTIFLNALEAKLGDLGLPQEIAAEAEGYLEQVLRPMAIDDPMRAPLLTAYAAGSRATFIFMAALSALGLLITIGIKHSSMDKMFESRFTVRLPAEAAGAEQEKTS